MEIAGVEIALYGRFTPGMRARLAAELAAQGARLGAKPPGCAVLIIGAQSQALLRRGRLQETLAAAAGRAARILSQARAERLLLHDAPPPPAPTAPLEAVLQGRLTPADAQVLAAFDLITLEGDHCSFADALVLRAAGELAQAGQPWEAIVRALAAAKRAPPGRRRLAADEDGEAVLVWEDGRSTPAGQGLLPLPPGAPASARALFEAALQAQAEGDLEEARALFRRAAQADRRDPFAAHNEAAILLAQGDWQDAARACQRALVRKPDLVEARYNLAQALEQLGRSAAAAAELEHALAIRPDYADALFNLAQLRLSDGRTAEAEGLYRRFLAAEPHSSWAAKAERALAYCRARSALGA